MPANAREQDGRREGGRRRRKRSHRNQKPWWHRLGLPQFALAAPARIWPHCEHCGQPLSLRRFFKQRRASDDLSYPFTMPNGQREELQVRWLCGGCERRAERLREKLWGDLKGTRST
jgi:hypothetical protein